jgi:hypothetical protein
MRRTLATCLAAAATLAAPGVAHAGAPGGFTPVRVAAPDVAVRQVAAADGAVTYLDDGGNLWATRVGADGTPGSPLPVAQGQADVRGLQVLVTERRETIVLWAAIASPTRSVVRYAVAAPGIGFSGVQTLARVGSNTGATPRAAALRGGTVAVILRDTRPPQATGVLRYARRAPGRTFGPARSLGHDGVDPEIRASPGGGALLAWARGPLSRRALEVGSARRGASLPGAGTSVAGRIRAFTLAAGPDGTAWVTWTRRAVGTTGWARRTRAGNRGAVGPVRSLGAVAYGVPHTALGPSSQPLAAWNSQGPDLQPHVLLSAAVGSGDALGPARQFDAGGFSQTSPLPEWAGATPLVLFTRQLPEGDGVRNEVAAADPGSGDAIALGTTATIATPAVAETGGGVLVAWPAAGGGVAVAVAFRAAVGGGS